MSLPLDSSSTSPVNNDLLSFFEESDTTVKQHLPEIEILEDLAKTTDNVVNWLQWNAIVKSASKDQRVMGLNQLASQYDAYREKIEKLAQTLLASS